MVIILNKKVNGEWYQVGEYDTTSLRDIKMLIETCFRLGSYDNIAQVKLTNGEKDGEVNE